MYVTGASSTWLLRPEAHQTTSPADPPGVYNVNGQLSTYQQSQGPAPTAHAAGASSNCQAVATVGGAAAAYT